MSTINHATNQARLDASRLRINLTQSPRAVPRPDDPSMMNSSICTDHMITAQWTLAQGWEAPQLLPYGPLSLLPTCSVLHYATECFEGLKLYRSPHDSRLRLFRVNRNCERMRRSAARIALPDFEASELQKLIVRLCAVDGPKWLPASRAGTCLYIRPTLISNDDSLGVQKPGKALLFVILNFLPDFSKPQSLPPLQTRVTNDIQIPAQPEDGSEEVKPEVQGLKLLASSNDSIRAWPGGFGFAKLGANYGPSLVAQAHARERGFNQILWLFGDDARVTEAGASNFFVVWRTREGDLQLVTADLYDGIILEGITRSSILDLVRARLSSLSNGASHDNHHTAELAKIEKLQVVERQYTMSELQAAADEGRLVEAFAAGTAYFVAPVGLVEWQGKEIIVPTCEGKTGTYARIIREWLSDIMFGKTAHEWGVVVHEETINGGEHQT